MSVEVNIKELFASGAHFGHKTSRWHPKMAPYIHSVRNGVHVINLEETVKMASSALKVVVENASRDRQILLVSTKKQAVGPVAAAAKVHDQPYVVNRWMGGLLTNNKTIKKRIKHLKDLEKRMDSGELAQRYSKLEVQRFQEEIDMLNDQFGGIKEMSGLPGLVLIIDINKDGIAVKEATKLGIPVIGVVDTNSNPSGIDYPIPANDDAIKTIELLLGYVNSAIAEGKAKPRSKKSKEEKPGDGPKITKKPAKPVVKAAPKKAAPKEQPKKTPPKKSAAKKATKSKPAAKPAEAKGK